MLFISGNNWGKCKNDTYALGCGSQETFKACSDIAIGNNFKAATPNADFTTTTTMKPFKDKTKFTILRPHITIGMSFEEAMEKIKKDPRLRWMLKPKK